MLDKLIHFLRQVEDHRDWQEEGKREEKGPQKLLDDELVNNP